MEAMAVCTGGALRGADRHGLHGTRGLLPVSEKSGGLGSTEYGWVMFYQVGWAIHPSKEEIGDLTAIRFN